MFIVIDKDKNRLVVDDTVYGVTYYCPLCEQPLVLKDGPLKRKHFAHKGGGSRECDDWHSDMSEWHRNWQEQFPEECREVVIEEDGVKHRADVLVNDRVVVEFQHSKMSLEEFNERNRFYTLAGYKIVWLFDLTEEFESDTDRRIESFWGDYRYTWKYHWKTFNGFNPGETSDIKVFFQLTSNLLDEHNGIKHLVGFSDDMKMFYTETEKIYEVMKRELGWNREAFVKLIYELSEEEETEEHIPVSYQVQTPPTPQTPPKTLDFVSTLYDIIKYHSRADRVVVKNIRTKISFEIDLIDYYRTQPQEISGLMHGKYMKTIYYPYQKIWILEKERINGVWI